MNGVYLERGGDVIRMRKIKSGEVSSGVRALFVYPWRIAWMFGFLWIIVGCTPSGIVDAALGDIRPPLVRSAKLESACEFRIAFDEPVVVRSDSFSVEPKNLVASTEIDEGVINIRLEPQPNPGKVVTLVGNVEDMSGNSTHVQVQFKGYNDRPAALMLSEVQTGKNSSKKSPHRDYIEWYVKNAGNLGGMYVQWASSTKIMRYDFPSCEVKQGDVVVLHLAPEGLADEKDEPEGDMALSGGIDATSTGRDFWSNVGGLPDSSGVISVYKREGEAPSDGLFYAESSKSGTVVAPKMIALVQELSDAGLWSLETPPQWEDAFLWKASSSKSLVRIEESIYGIGAWTISESGGQSPGIVVR